MYCIKFLRSGRHAVPKQPWMPQVEVVEDGIYGVPDEVNELIAAAAIKSGAAVVLEPASESDQDDSAIASQIADAIEILDREDSALWTKDGAPTLAALNDMLAELAEEGETPLVASAQQRDAAWKAANE